MRIAWIGLGRMGEPMARHVLRRGFDLAVTNRTAGTAAALVSEGARAAASPREAAASADATFVMVATPEAFEAVLDGGDGALAGLRPGSVLVDLGTDGPGAAVR